MNPQGSGARVAPPAPRFPGTDLVAAAAALFRNRPAWTEGLACGLTGHPGRYRLLVDLLGEEGREFRLTVSAGTVGVSMTDPARRERNRQDGLGNDPQMPAAVVGDIDAEGVWTARTPTEWAEPDPARQVEGWSRRSRARMVRTLAQLDWTPLYDQGRPSVMLTLTYPGEWEQVVPTGKDCKRHLRAFQKRWARRWGTALVGAWKLEFQRRGAPHLHLLTVPPADPGFRRWLSQTWADVVKAERLCTADRACWESGDGTCCEYGRHRLAGTGADHLRGGRMFDPKRAAVYFSKHGGAAGGKEYQHTVPQLWQAPGAGPGRFWGYWGLERVTRDVVLNVGEYVQLRRTMRRWSRAQGLTRTTRVPRGATVDTATGELTTRYRTVTRPMAYLSHSSMHGGTLVLNDGPAFAAHLAAQLATTRRGELRLIDAVPAAADHADLGCACNTSPARATAGEMTAGAFSTSAVFADD